MTATAPALTRPEAEDALRPVGYGALIRGNRNFRLLWLGTIISLFGDWFNTIALYGLVTVLTGSPLAVGLVETLKLAGYAVASIPAGPLADRLDRRKLMVATDLLRAAIVPCFLLVDGASDLPLLYGLIIAQIALGAVFDPAFRALTPNLVSPAELLPANTLLSATWSALLALGASLGGLAAAGLGLEAVFLIDAATYLVSAACIAAIRLPPKDVGAGAAEPGAKPDEGAAEPGAEPDDRPAPRPPRGRQIPLSAAFRVAFQDLAEGLAFLRAHPAVFRLSLAKTAWVIGGGGLVYLLTQLGPQLTPADPALGIGLLYAARGLGTGLGPLIARRLFPRPEAWATLSGLAVAASGLAYILAGTLSASFFVIVPLVLAHAASGTNWVFSTVALQARVPDHVRGRILAVELMILTAVEAVFVLGTAAILEATPVPVATAILACAALQVTAGLAYAAWVRAARA